MVGIVTDALTDAAPPDAITANVLQSRGKSDLKKKFNYSQVSNKRAGWTFFWKLIIEQDGIDKQDGNFSKNY